MDDGAIIGKVDFRPRDWVGFGEHGWNNKSTPDGKIVSGSSSNWIQK